MENTQLNKLRPPRLATTVGMAVPTMVLSRAARAMAISTAITTNHFCRSMFVVKAPWRQRPQYWNAADGFAGKQYDAGRAFTLGLSDPEAEGSVGRSPYPWRGQL